MTSSILIQDVKVGQEFILLNKRGTQKTNSTYVMRRNTNGYMVDYERLDRSKYYGSMLTTYNQYVELI